MSQITIGGKTLNFKDSVYTGDQWEQVASWVLNGGGTQIDENVEIAVKKDAGKNISGSAIPLRYPNCESDNSRDIVYIVSILGINMFSIVFNIDVIYLSNATGNEISKNSESLNPL